MKTNKILLATAIAASVMAGSCSEERFAPEGEGRLMLTAAINTEVRDASRADAETEELGESCMIWISNEKGLVRRYIGINNLPADGIKLLNGRYTVEAWAGDSVTASFESRWFKGRESFEITAGSMERKTVVCKIANVVARVNYNAIVDEVLADYTMTIANSRGQLVYTGRTDADGYFMMPTGDNKLTWTLSGKKAADGSEFTKSGEILDVQPATRYTLNVTYTNDNTEVGGAYFDIEVDTEEILVEDVVEITTAPEIRGYNFDIARPVVGEEGSIGRRSVFVVGATALKSVILDCEAFPELLGIDGNDFDLLDGIDPAVLETINNGGITTAFFPTSDGATDRMLKINFEENFTSKLKNGDYTVGIAATDSKGKTSRATLTFSVTDAKTQNEPVNDLETYANRTVLRGSVVKDGVESVGFNYRRSGASEWIYVEATVVSRALAVGTVFTAEIEGLEPATNYEYTTVADGVPSAAVSTFRTESAPQLPNASFEDWVEATPTLICANESSMFWDSGNHGSATMKINITTPTTAFVHSGARAAKLESAYPSMFGIGKFAAGNAFVGKYLATDGTDGILGFGRPFEGRPTAMKVYVRYEPVEINRKGSDLPDFVKTSGLDEGMIYIALLDDSKKEVSYKGQSWQYPIVIQTKSRQLFDNKAGNVIAYGERVFTERTAGDGFEEVIIPIEYRRTDIKPSNIAVVCSGSRYGDYFTGGEGTVMYIDDVELIY